MTRYPIVLQSDDNDTLLVTFPDFPEATTFGETREEALGHAKNALGTIIDAYVSAGRVLPVPSVITREAVEWP